MAVVEMLHDMPRFAGNPKSGEAPFKSEINARTFMRTIENYFQSNNVTADEQKLHILFYLIDKKRGDAITFLTCYINKSIPFAKVKEQFLSIYSPFKFTEFQDAAKSLLETNLTPNNIFCGMTSLHNTSRAAAKAYLNHAELTKGDFDDKTILPSPRGDSIVPLNPDAPDTPTQQIYLMEVLQNFAMHLYVSTQTPNIVYEKLHAIGPRNCCTEFMVDTIYAMEEYKLDDSDSD